MTYHNLHPALVFIALALIGAGIAWGTRAIVLRQTNADHKESNWRKKYRSYL